MKKSPRKEYIDKKPPQKLHESSVTAQFRARWRHVDKKKAKIRNFLGEKIESYISFPSWFHLELKLLNHQQFNFISSENKPRKDFLWEHVGKLKKVEKRKQIKTSLLEAGSSSPTSRCSSFFSRCKHWNKTIDLHELHKLTSIS
jgi:hypothetical protein